jgi:hypothetical protein
MKDSHLEESNKTLLVLLEKAEQIISIINLSDGIIKKYNQLKEMTFEKLGLEYHPLVKKISSTTNTHVSREDTNILYDVLNRTRNINNKKNLIIEFLFDLIEKFKFENNTYMKNYLYDHNFLSQIDKIYSSNINFYKNIEDIEFDLKMEEIKIKDFLGKSEINYKKFLSGLKFKDTNFTTNKSLGNIYGENTLDDVNKIDDVVRDYERKIDEIRRSHEREITEYREKYNDLRTKYNPDLEKEIFKLRDELEESRYINHKINDLVTPIYEKYYQKNATWYENEKMEFKYKELDMINFTISLVHKFFNDNKYLIDLVSSLQKDKISLIEERNLPFVINTIQNNHLLNEIYEDSKILQCQSDNFSRNLDQVMDFINKNFENI